MSFLEITEEWIKDRVKITSEKLDDIKSLSLPGTYDEKIFKLGTSLFHFTRIKELDLSRNVLESLEGIDHLRCLESLNLYYNNVGSLKELYRLKSNPALAQLDLRLNPVARNEADYRLCLIHMLPLLIRLDDRCVKDQERKAALMYFGSDQSREFSSECVSQRDELDRSCTEVMSKKTHPRVEMVNRWTKGIVKEDVFDRVFNDSDNLHINLNDVETEETEIITAPRFKDQRYSKEYSPRERLSVEREYSNDKEQSFRANKSRANYSTVPVYVRQDELGKAKENHDKCHGDNVTQLNLDENIDVDLNVHCGHTFPRSNITSIGNVNGDQKGAVLPRELTDRICDFVDRYWNGSRSLHQNQTFLVAVSRIINDHSSKSTDESDMKREINYFKESNFKLEEENRNLKEKVSVTKSYSKSTDREDVADIKRANRILKDEISELRRKLEASEKLSELTDLLKQSHDSLITTNEQLRKQLSQQNKPIKSKGY